MNNQGWICPKCNNVLSPSAMYCIFCNKSEPNEEENNNMKEDDIDNPLKGISGKSWQFEQNVYSEDSRCTRAIKAGEGSGNIPKVIETEPKLEQVDLVQTVKNRVYVVDTEKLSNLLIIKKAKLKLSNSDIAKILGLPKTQVDHYFRTDKYFAIPDPEIWLQLKELLDITTDEFDKAIMTFEEKENEFDQSNRAYKDTGLAPTLTVSADSKIVESDYTNPTTVLYKDKEVELPCIAASRGRDPENPSNREPGGNYEQTLEINTNGTTNTLTSVQKDNYVLEEDKNTGYSDSSLKRIANNIIKGDIANTLTANAMQSINHNNCALIEDTILIKNATKQGYLEANEGDGVNISSRMKYQRGNVQKDSIQTLDCAGGNDRGVVTNGTTGLRIRKLTPSECWRTNADLIEKILLKLKLD